MSQILAVLALLTTLLHPEFGTVDPEEGATAAQAAVVVWSNPAAAIAYAWRPFCGGCTLQALWSAPWLAVLGPATWVWKLTLVPWIVAAVVATDLIARDTGADRVASALMVGAWPPLLSAAALRGWSNHFEATALAMLAVAVGLSGRARLVVGGAMAAAALLTSPTSALTLVPGAALIARRHGGPALAAWTAPWLLVAPVWGVTTAMTGRSPLDLSAAFAHPTPLTVKLGSLAEPARWAAAFGCGEAAPELGVALSAAYLSALALAWRRGGHAALLPWMCATWLVAFLAAPIELEDPRGSSMADLRYLVPPTLAAATAMAIGIARLPPPWSRAIALGWAMIAAAARPGPNAAPSASHLVDTDARNFFTLQSLILAHGDTDTWRCEDPACAATDAWRQGVLAARNGQPRPDDDVSALGWWQANAQRGAGDEASASTAPQAPPAHVNAAIALDRLAASPRPLPDTARPELAWAYGRWSSAAPGLKLPVVDLPPDAQAAWAFGAGQTWGARYGRDLVPSGLQRWPKASRDSFRQGIAEGLARPWSLRHGDPTTQHIR